MTIYITMAMFMVTVVILAGDMSMYTECLCIHMRVYEGT